MREFSSAKEIPNDSGPQDHLLVELSELEDKVPYS